MPQKVDHTRDSNLGTKGFLVAIIKAYRPKSIIQLTLVGFTCVAAPLIAALVLTLLNVERMAKHSEQAIFNMTQTTQLSQKLGKELTEMERYVRQFLLLKDASIYQLYLEEHNEIIEITDSFRSLKSNQDLTEILKGIVSIEAELFSYLDSTVIDEEMSNIALDIFDDLSVLGRRLLLASNLNIEQQTDEIQNKANEINSLLYLQSVILIPLALFLATIFTFLITRPLQQIDSAIHELGIGNFSAAIVVNGPRDLRKLGQRLDWLRIRLEELENQKISVLRHISHDLKTPLTALREGTELLSDGIFGELNRDQREISWILKSNTMKLQAQVEALLNFSATGNIFREDFREDVPLKSLIKNVIKEHILEIKTKQIRFKGELEDCKILGDPTQIKVIFDNIFSNAIKYSPRNGEIVVVLESGKNNVVLDVQDEGPGIASEEKNRVFEAFYQGKTASKGYVKGTGLGLAIAQEFAKLHKGIIETVTNTVGAHFRLTLARES